METCEKFCENEVKVPTSMHANTQLILLKLENITVFFELLNIATIANPKKNNNLKIQGSVKRCTSPPDRSGRRGMTAPTKRSRHSALASAL
jgi:hypothetical protein